MMPFVDGFKLVVKLRDNEYTSHIPIMILTAKADISSKIEGLQRGAEVYLEKPLTKKNYWCEYQAARDAQKFAAVLS